MRDSLPSSGASQEPFHVFNTMFPPAMVIAANMAGTKGPRMSGPDHFLTNSSESTRRPESSAQALRVNFLELEEGVLSVGLVGFGLLKKLSIDPPVFTGEGGGFTRVPEEPEAVRATGLTPDSSLFFWLLDLTPFNTSSSIINTQYLIKLPLELCHTKPFPLANCCTSVLIDTKIIWNSEWKSKEIVNMNHKILWTMESISSVKYRNV